MDSMSPSDRAELALRQTPWLRRLARQLVRDPDDAEDLVQETWVRAFERPPRAGETGSEPSLRAWLITSRARPVPRSRLRVAERSSSSRVIARTRGVVSPDAEPGG